MHYALHCPPYSDLGPTSEYCDGIVPPERSARLLVQVAVSKLLESWGATGFEAHLSSLRTLYAHKVMLADASFGCDACLS